MAEVVVCAGGVRRLWTWAVAAEEVGERERGCGDEAAE